MNLYVLIIKIYVIAGGFMVGTMIMEFFEPIRDRFHNEYLKVLVEGLRLFLYILALFLILLSLYYLDDIDVEIW